ncbi:hypothetical protein M1466_02160 [Candidatus Dependentiae bacterium]|nr:hypothetical protein [Candidatus Dependentiae bacterium]
MVTGEAERDALFAAVDAGEDDNAVAAWLTAGRPYCMTAKGSLISLAIRRGCIQLTRALLQEGIDPYAEQEPLLLLASRSGQMKMVFLLLEYMPILVLESRQQRKKFKKFSTQLQHCCYELHPVHMQELTSLIVQSLADFDETSPLALRQLQGWLAVAMVINRVDLAAFIVWQHTALLRSANSELILLYAMILERTDIVAMLLESNVVNIDDAMIIACHLMRPDLVERLCALGADIHYRNDFAWVIATENNATMNYVDEMEQLCLRIQLRALGITPGNQRLRLYKTRKKLCLMDRQRVQ